MSKTIRHLADHIRIARHYQRSIRIDADFGRSDALEGYICHGTARMVLENMTKQIAESNQRAFTWTGPYGGGKSSLALALASALSGDAALRKKANNQLRINEIPYFSKALPVKRGWLVIPVVGKRGSVAQEISQAFSRSLSNEGKSRNVPAARIIKSLCHAVAESKYDGVLLILDEMGKFLEASASGGDDIYFFQELAEEAARSKGKIVIVGILHQSFKQYAARLGLDSRDDWAKIQGRYVDIPLVAASDEIVDLIGRAIECDYRHDFSYRVAFQVAESIRHRRTQIGGGFANKLDKCWPLHPTIAALLGPASKRQFGQNERSTFGFLASSEPHGFREYLNSQSANEETWYGPDRYWDFLRANLEPTILASPDGHRWAQAAEAVERAEARGNALHVSLIKSIATIDLFRNGSGLAAETEILYTLSPSRSKKEIDGALGDLSRWKIAVFRKHVGAWAVFEGSDFDIDSAVSDIRGAMAGLDLDILLKHANLHPVVAKRHYYKTGTLRWMGVALCHLDEVENYISKYSPSSSEFGQFLLVLPGKDVALQRARKRIGSLEINIKRPIASGIPANYAKIYDLGAELLSLQLLQEKRPELEGDSVARREVAARLASARANLEQEMRNAFGNVQWCIPGGIEQNGLNNMAFIASQIADILFKRAPRLWSEMVNRNSLSPNAVKARKELLYRILSHGHEKNLGLEGYPAERGLYETLLRSTELHQYSEDSKCWRFVPPSDGPSKAFDSLWKKTYGLFDKANQRISLFEIYSMWEEQPYGIRSGVHPILLFAFLMSYKETIALYKDGVFLADITTADIDECLLEPRRFSLQKVLLNQERTEILRGVGKILANLDQQKVQTNPLETARALVSIILTLPQWVQRTQKLTKRAMDVRDALLKANDPHKVLFVDLATLLNVQTSKEYVKELKEPLAELIRAYPIMLQKVADHMMRALDAISDPREHLKQRAFTVAGIAGDLRLEALSSRLAAYEGKQEQIEDILSLAANKPPRDWNDRDIDNALIAIAELAMRFRQVEALAAIQGRIPTRDAISVVIGAGGKGKTVNHTFDIASRERPKVKALAESILKDFASKKISSEIILAALAEAGMSIIEANAHGE